MKKIVLLLIAMSIFLTSCFSVGERSRYFMDKQEIADETFAKVVDCIKNTDAKQFKSLFSKYAQENCIDFDKKTSDFFNFIEGDIVSFSEAFERGVSADGQIENGKRMKRIQSSFCLETTESKYYIAINEYITDEFDDGNLGISSIYVVGEENWDGKYSYRGDGKWTLGINVVTQLDE